MQETLQSCKLILEIVFIYLATILLIAYVALAWTGAAKKLGSWLLDNTTAITKAVDSVVSGLKTFLDFSCKLKVKIISSVILVIYLVLVVLYFIYLK